MLIDTLPFRETLRDPGVKNKSLKAFVEYLEKALGVSIVRDIREIPFGRTGLQKPLELAALLKQHGIIKELGPVQWPVDQPRMKGWYSVCNIPNNHQASGATWNDDESALYAALAEALERYIWMSQDDYLKDKIKATAAQISKRGRYIAPETIVGFTDEQRAMHPRRELRADAAYVWTQGTSLLNGAKIYVPAQVVSGFWGRNGPKDPDEPIIRQPITNGLATWHTQKGARLSGILEVIERESYMMMWLNQLTLPRVRLDSLSSRYPSLAAIFATCERYRMKVHVIPLLTDAPTHVVAVVVEDLSGHALRFSVGLKAHASLSFAIQKAITEALRAQNGYRVWTRAGNTWDMTTPMEKIGHRDRVYYWGVPEHAKHLEFLVSGKEIDIEDKVWDDNTIDQHYEKIIRWCKDTNIECISFPLTSSAKNPTQWHIEMVVMPQMQPTYLNESIQQFGGTRWRDIPKAMGYPVREKPFSERPHPFS